MKGLIELSNFVVETVSSKYTTPSETEGEVDDTPTMYLKCMGKCFQLNFPKLCHHTIDLYLMDSQVVELEKLYRFAYDHC